MPQDAFFQEQNEVQPKLNPPIYRWQEDMPENNQPQLVPPQLIYLNKKNNIWMEIPRYSGIMWRGMIFGGVITFAATLFVVVMSFIVAIDVVNVFGFSAGGCALLILFLLSNFSLVSLVLFFLKCFF